MVTPLTMGTIIHRAQEVAIGADSVLSEGLEVVAQNGGMENARGDQKLRNKPPPPGQPNKTQLVHVEVTGLNGGVWKGTWDKAGGRNADPTMGG